MPGAVLMRTLYFRPGLVRRPPVASAVLHLTPLLRELILEAVRIGKLRARQLHERALRDLLVLHLESASSVPTFVPLPRTSEPWHWHGRCWPRLETKRRWQCCAAEQA